MKRAYELKTVDGMRALALTRWGWDDQLIDVVVKKRIEFLSIAGVDSDISFVARLPPLRRLVLPVTSPTDLRALEELGGIEELMLLLGPGRSPTVNFDRLPALRVLGLDWIRGVESVSECRGLERLTVGRPPDSDLGWLPSGEQLIQLHLTSGRKLRSLRGIERAPALRELELIGLPALSDVEPLANATLRRLTIDGCKSIERIESVGAMTTLETLTLDNGGPIATLAPLRSLQRLKSFFATASTNVVDGDLSPLLDLPALRNFGMQNRRHYTPSVSDIQDHLRAHGRHRT